MFQLRDVLDLDVMKEAQILAGAEGLDREVTFVTVMDVPTITEWVREGEMLLVANQFIDVATSTFFDKLNAKRISAVVVKPSFQPALTSDVLERCNQIGLPIIKVPARMSWSDIINPVTQMFARTQYDAIYQSQQFHSLLMHSLISGASLDQLCTDIRHVTHLSIAIADRSLTVLGKTSDEPWYEMLSGFSTSKASYSEPIGDNTNENPMAGYVYTNQHLKERGQRVLAFPIQQSWHTLGYVFVLRGTDSDNLDIYENMQIGQIMLVGGLYIIKQMELNNAVRRYNNLLLDRILLAPTLGKRERAEISASLRQRFHDLYYVAVADFPDVPAPLDTKRQPIMTLFNAIKAAESDFLDVLCFERGDNLVFFLPASIHDPQHTSERLLDICSSMLNCEVRIGVSEQTHSEFQKAYHQAMQALGAVEPSSNRRFRMYEELGIMRFFMDRAGSLDDDFLRSMTNRYVEPLIAYDATHGTELLDTLILYLANNHSAVKTQSALYIHKNTLRARLARIEKLLDVSLSSADDLFNIQLALKINRHLSGADRL